jgi:conjugal transfer pilus assembly protein TraW
MELMKKHNVRFYFDQKSILTLKLGITQVPAIVTQNGMKLRIEELVLGK